MAVQRQKVVVAMSGGVDSSVAACLLVEQGYEVIGLFMRVGAEAADGPLPDGRGSDFPPGSDLQRGSDSPAGAAERQASASAKAPGRAHRGCCSAGDAADARFVAGMLGIPFYALNFQADFERIIDYFADEYVRGRTPNPCIVCNDRLKFGKIVDYADAVGARYIATGHYARGGTRRGRRVLMRGIDRAKDQSYVLFGLKRAILDRVLFPIGGLTKPEVRETAERFGLPVHDKPDSVDICFVPDRDYARVVRGRHPEAFAEGDVIDESGKVLGRHNGIGQYTIGQRRGLRIAAGRPVYVTQLNVERNTVTLAGPEALLAGSLIADRANFLVDVVDQEDVLHTDSRRDPMRRLDACFRADVKIRYLHQAAPATVQRLERGRIRVVFDEPQRAITPGQAIVFYDRDVVLGGAWIDHAEQSTANSE